MWTILIIWGAMAVMFAGVYAAVSYYHKGGGWE